LTLAYDAGNADIYTATGTGGEGGANLTIYAGASDSVTWNSNSGGSIFIEGGYGAFADGGGGPGGEVHIKGGFK